MSFLIPLLQCALIAEVILAQQTNSFINPPSAGRAEFFLDNPILTIGQDISVKWSTDLEQYSIALWQQSLNIGIATVGPNVYTKIPGGPEEGQFNWTVDNLGFSLSQSNVFYFNLTGTLDDVENVVTSHYFNMTRPSAVTSSSSSISPSSTSTASSSNSTSPSEPASIATASIATAPAETSTDNSSTDTPTKVGIGVGLGLGIPLMALVGYLALLRRKRAGPIDTISNGLAPPYSQQPTDSEYSYPVRELPDAQYPSKRGGFEHQIGRHGDFNEPVELDTGSRGHSKFIRM